MWVTVTHPVLCKNANRFRGNNIDGRRVHPAAYKHKLGILTDVETYHSTLFELNDAYTAPYTLYAERCIIPNKAYILGLAQEQRTH